MPEHRQGQTVLLAPVAQAEPVVRRWREELDPTVAEGLPAHIGILFPFVDDEEIDEQVLSAVSDIVGARPAIDLRLVDVRRFPDGNVYLHPEPDAPLRELTEAIWHRWPEHPPYEGRFEQIIPHLTVAIEPPESRVAEIEEALRRHLPVDARVDSVELRAYDGARWRRIASFDLA